MHQSFWNILILVVVSSIIIILLFFCFIYYILKLHQQKQLEFKSNLIIIEKENENKILTTTIEVHEETIQKISREIHDNVNQLLTLSKLKLNLLSSNSEPDNSSNLEPVKELISLAIYELTNMSRSLNGEFLREFGIFRAIEVEVERINTLGLVTIVSEISFLETEFNIEKQLIFYRIFQEAVKNAIVHGKASEIKVMLCENHHRLQMTIIDNGCGFDISETQIIKENKQFGLQNMKKRMDSINGEIVICSELNKGTQIELSAPVSNAIISQ